MDKIALYESDSDSDLEPDIDNAEQTHIQLPPLPDVILDQFHRAPSLPDQMNIKQVIRTPSRLFNSFCSIEFKPSNQQVSELSDISQNLDTIIRLAPTFRRLNITKLEPLYRSDYILGASKELHVSLTGNIVLERDQQEIFKSKLLTNLAQLKNNDPLRFSFGKLMAIPNFTKTKLFIALQLTNESILQLTPIHEAISDSLKQATKGDHAMTNDIIMVDLNQAHASILETAVLQQKVTDEDIEQLNTDIGFLEVPTSLEFSYTSVKMNNGTSRRSFNIGKY